LTSCATYIASGAEGATSGNTLQCRQYHAGVALTGDATAKSTHCPHAGATPTAFCVATAGSSSGGTSTGTNAASGLSASLVLVAAAIAAAIAAKQL
jgi:hypothetical protein